MKVIGLTGNSGCGKGVVAEIMSKYGAFVLDCDKIAHDNMKPFGIAYGEIVEAFGDGILNEDCTINRRILGSIVFKYKEKLILLNSITHKYVVEVINNAIRLNRDKNVIVIDAPLLIEAGLQRYCDSVWAVYAPLEVRLERVIKRDNIDRKGALLRFQNQMNIEELKRYSDVIIENNCSLEELEEIVLEKMKEYDII